MLDMIEELSSIYSNISNSKDVIVVEAIFIKFIEAIHKHHVDNFAVRKFCLQIILLSLVNGVALIVCISIEVLCFDKFHERKKSIFHRVSMCFVSNHLSVLIQSLAVAYIS